YLLDGLRVDARSRDVRAEPVEAQQRGGERELLADVRDREGAQDRREHARVPLLEYVAGSTGGLDALARGRTESVGVDGQRLGDLALREHLHRDASALREVVRVQRLERDLGAGLEARLEIDQVDRLRVRPEGFERHRLLHVRAAQLAHPHVDRHLAALEARPVLRARARAVALLAAAGRLAGAGALAAADALARTAAAGSRSQVVQADA